MKKDFIIFTKGSEWTYAASIASTWIWAPALFVSSSKAFFSGIYGLLWFIIPNILTLILFGYLSSKVTRKDHFSLTHVVKTASDKQANLHCIISLVLLTGSTVVQLLGIHTLASEWLGTPKWVSASLILFLCLVLVWKNGLKDCIRTDVVKYIILLVCGIILTVSTVISGEFNGWYGFNNPDFIHETATFGIITLIGLFSSPYVDQTFWQRAFSIEKDRVFSVFCKSAVLFGVIPILFGTIGFFSSGGTGWSIATNFNGIGAVILALGVLSALLSTLDSNLCAISSFVWKANRDEHKNITYARMSMVALVIFGGGTFLLTDFTIVQWTLIYGTIRTCAALPTVLVILNKYDPEWLFKSTLTGSIIAPIGYFLYAGSGYEWLFTLFGLLVPLLGYRNKSKI